MYLENKAVFKCICGTEIICNQADIRKGRKFCSLSCAHKHQKRTHLSKEQKAIRSIKVLEGYKRRTAEQESIRISKLTEIRNSPARAEFHRKLKRDYWSKFDKEQRREMLAHAQQASRHNWPSSIEIMVKEILDALGVDYLHNVRFAGYYPDFRVESRKLIIECDGRYWHSRPGSKEHDQTRDRKFSELGYEVIRLSEQEIKRDAKTAVTAALKLVA